MTGTPQYLVAMVRRPVPGGCHVVPGSTPVVAFGDPHTSPVATLGINPSRAEFVDGGRLLSGPRRRLATLQSLNAGDTGSLTDTQVAQVVADCARYFSRNPYRTWFDPLDGILRSGLGASYYSSTACHLDIVQWATDPVWSKIPDRTARTRLLHEGVEHLRTQLEQERVQVVVVNGSQVWEQLRATRLASFGDVGSLPVGAGGTKTTTLRRGEGCGATFVGWTLNVQGSFGVTREDRSNLAHWLRSLDVFD